MWPKQMYQLFKKSLLEPATVYEPVEKSLIERAFTNLKSVAKTDKELGIKIGLVSSFYGFIGEQVVQSSLGQVGKLTLPSHPNDPIHIRFPHDVAVETLRRKRINLEVKTTPPGYVCMTVNVDSWNKHVDKHGTPHMVIAVKMEGEKIRMPWLLKTLTEKLTWFADWVENYHDQLDAEIVGWMPGAEVKYLDVADGEFPCFRDPCRWCYLNDKRLRPMNTFWNRIVDVQALLKRLDVEMHRKR